MASPVPVASIAWKRGTPLTITTNAASQAANGYPFVCRATGLVVTRANGATESKSKAQFLRQEHVDTILSMIAQGAASIIAEAEDTLKAWIDSKDKDKGPEPTIPTLRAAYTLAEADVLASGALVFDVKPRASGKAPVSLSAMLPDA